MEYFQQWAKFKPPIRESLILNFCWICMESFEGQVIKPKEEHHVIPRSYGGSNGPTVSICTACHTNVHDCGEALFRGNPTQVYRYYSDEDQLERALYLANVICNSKMLHLNDPKKRVVYSGFFEASTHTKLKALVKHLGGSRKTSQHKVIVHAIEELFKRHIGIKDK